MDRRQFLKTIGLGAVGLAAARGATGLWADPGRPAGLSRVALARADHLYLHGPLVLPLIYPEGRLDSVAVQGLLDGVMTQLTGERTVPDQWARYVKGSDRVGLMVDVRPLPVPMPLVDLVVDRLVKAGVKEQSIFVFAGTERELFSAGYSLDNDSAGVAVLSSDSEGYRNGLSRLLLESCDVVINLARLGPDSTWGLRGALTNYLSLAPPERRVELRSAPLELPSLAAHPLVRGKVKLHLVDVLHPAWQPPPDPYTDFRWEYAGLLASADPVALDALGQRLLEAKRAQIKGQPWPLEPAPEFIAAAQSRYHLGWADPAQIDLHRTGYTTDELI